MFGITINKKTELIQVLNHSVDRDILSIIKLSHWVLYYTVQHYIKMFPQCFRVISIVKFDFDNRHKLKKGGGENRI